LIFIRPPSLASPNAQSIYWQSNAMVNQFNQSYRNLPDWYIATTTSTSPQTYYYCGN
jgi:hypothetical protein